MPMGFRIILALLSGAMTTLAYAPFGYWPLAVITPAVLLGLLGRTTPRQALLLGYSWGFAWLAPGLSWLHVSIEQFGGMPWLLSWLVYLLLVAYLALFPALCAWGLVRLFPRGHGRLLAFPVLWIGCEWLRANLLTGFPWLRLGYSQTDSPLSALLPVLGINGLDLVLAALASALAALFIVRRHWLLSSGFIVLMLGGSALLRQAWHWTTPVSEPPLRLALVQGNVPQAIKWAPDQLLPTLLLYRELTEQAKDAELVIWPESAIPATEQQMVPFLSQYDALLKRQNKQLITGLIDYQPENKVYYNKLLALGEGLPGYRYGQSPSYQKHHLVPFGEFVPLENLLRHLGPLFNLPQGSFSRGDRVQPNILLSTSGGDFRLLSTICYEILLSGQVRDNFDRTDVILTISNDAWFGDSIGPHQHLQIARTRAIELGRPVIRSTNNGITALIDASGSITGTIPQFEQAVLTGELQRVQGVTPFLRWGSTPSWILAGLMLLIALWRRFRQPRQSVWGVRAQNFGD